MGELMAKKTLKKRYPIHEIPIVHAKLSDDANLIGAALLQKEMSK
jgi:hypothetical protein